ncbi:hypothetical protein A0H76_1956 [Hepatospora eriocheir]|uniref:Uncharacterized protein n=1 Tax=Hepatospora eriocheir TaxID=1081669 RepID=A0A1X0QG59_9MICR|nr:hypothetical protein A0H76_1956 [Hepatospora eriocheir]
MNTIDNVQFMNEENELYNLYLSNKETIVPVISRLFKLNFYQSVLKIISNEIDFISSNDQLRSEITKIITSNSNNLKKNNLIEDFVSICLEFKILKDFEIFENLKFVASLISLQKTFKIKTNMVKYLRMLSELCKDLQPLLYLNILYFLINLNSLNIDSNELIFHFKRVQIQSIDTFKIHLYESSFKELLCGLKLKSVDKLNFNVDIYSYKENDDYFWNLIFKNEPIKIEPDLLETFKLFLRLHNIPFEIENNCFYLEKCHYIDFSSTIYEIVKECTVSEDEELISEDKSILEDNSILEDKNVSIKEDSKLLINLKNLSIEPTRIVNSLNVVKPTKPVFKNRFISEYAKDKVVNLNGKFEKIDKHFPIRKVNNILLFKERKRELEEFQEFLNNKLSVIDDLLERFDYSIDEKNEVIRCENANEERIRKEEIERIKKQETRVLE